MQEQFTKSKAIALFHGKCPRCQTGKVFKYSPLSLSKFTEMHEHCPVCGLKFEIEPGFFWGSMFVSYALTTGMMLTLGALVLVIGHNPDFWWYMGVIGGSVILCTTFLYRYSRLLMLYFFSPIRFDKRYAGKN